MRPQTDQPNERATLTLEEMARRLGVSRSTAYDLAKRDALPVPVIRLGRRIVVSRAALDGVLSIHRGGGEAAS